MRNDILTILILFITGALLAQCRNAYTAESLEGTYNAYLQSEGGMLRFPLQMKLTEDSLHAFIVNGADTTRFNKITLKNDSLILGFDFYASYLKAKINRKGNLQGYWTKRTSYGAIEKLPFKASKNTYYLKPSARVDNQYFDGNWQTTFTDGDGSFPAFGTFVSEANGNLYGTFQTETGDYRFLQGNYSDSSFTLSTFDGAHAFLFKAHLKPDSTLKGRFWSGDDYYATWTAQRGKNMLRNPLQISANQAVGKPMAFSFPTIEGHTISADDKHFKNKPMLVYIFGSWCPNCADEVQMLRTLYQNKYEDSELEIIGLAYELTGNFAQDAEMVSRYKKRFAIPWMLLVAGISDKNEAAKTLPFLQDVVSFPTSIFVDKNHTIKAIHVGFNGPATGSAYFNEIQRFNTHINEIIE